MIDVILHRGKHGLPVLLHVREKVIAEVPKEGGETKAELARHELNKAPACA